MGTAAAWPALENLRRNYAIQHCPRRAHYSATLVLEQKAQRDFVTLYDEGQRRRACPQQNASGWR